MRRLSRSRRKKQVWIQDVVSCRGVAAISYIFALLGFMTVMTYTTKKESKRVYFALKQKGWVTWQYAWQSNQMRMSQLICISYLDGVLQNRKGSSKPAESISERRTSMKPKESCQQSFLWPLTWFDTHEWRTIVSLLPVRIAQYPRKMMLVIQLSPPQTSSL